MEIKLGYMYEQGRNNQNLRQPQNLNRIRSRLNQLECRNCSKWARTPKYHHGPYGGGPTSNCPYDRTGRPRPGYAFIKQIEGQEVSQIDQDSQDETDIVYDDNPFLLDEDEDENDSNLNHVTDSFPF